MWDSTARGPLLSLLKNKFQLAGSVWAATQSTVFDVEACQLHASLLHQTGYVEHISDVVLLGVILQLLSVRVFALPSHLEITVYS